MSVSDDELLDARRERRRILERITWWDLHRGELLFPMAIALFALGYGAGYAARALLGAPERTELVVALASLLIVGRVVERRFSTRQLDRIDARIALLERSRRSAP